MINCPSCWQHFFKLNWPIHDGAIPQNVLNRALAEYNATYHTSSIRQEVHIKFRSEADYYLFLLKFSQ